MKEIWKIIAMPTIKSFYLSFGIGFFFKYIIYFSFIAEKNEKKHTFNKFSTKNFKLPNGPKFNCCISILVTIKKIHQKITLTTLVLKYVCNFSYSTTSIILLQIYFICWSSLIFVKFFFLNDCFKFKSNPIYF